MMGSNSKFLSSDIVILIFKASRYDIKGRKYIGANLKYYFTDPWLQC